MKVHHSKPVSLADARDLFDLTSGQTCDTWRAIAEEQLEGAVDLYARLLDYGISWLCDEVGLGKTYVAMAVAALTRRQHPDARILYVLPSSRLLPKWTRELSSFSRRNVSHRDHLLRTLRDRPARPLVPVETLHELALEATLDPDRDFLCTLGAFSFALPKQRQEWRSSWDALLRLLPEAGRDGLRWEDWALTMPDDEDSTAEAKLQVKIRVAEVINRLLPDFDLVVCDESHNLRHGLQSPAARNRMLSVALGGVYGEADRATPRVADDDTPRLRRRARRVLMLTATPFRSHFDELASQAAVFGFVDHGGKDTPEVVGTHLEPLSRNKADEQRVEALVAQRDELVRQLVVRRLGSLTIGGQPRTRNQYRTEFR